MMEIQGATSSSSKPEVTTTADPSLRDKVIAATTLAIVVIYHPRATSLRRGCTYSVEDIANALNGTNENDDGDRYVNFRFLCHALKLFWKTLKQRGWDHSKDDSKSCRGLAIASFPTQGDSNYRIKLPDTIPPLASDRDYNDMIAFRNSLLEGTNIGSIGGMSSLFPLSNPREEMEKMAQLSDF